MQKAPSWKHREFQAGKDLQGSSSEIPSWKEPIGIIKSSTIQSWNILQPFPMPPLTAKVAGPVLEKHLKDSKMWFP